MNTDDSLLKIEGHATTELKICVTVAGCHGSPVELTEAEGTFGISSSQYENNMRCGWTIRVDPSKVSNFTLCCM